MDKDQLEVRMGEMTTELIEHCEAVVILAAWTNQEFDSTLYSYRGMYQTVLGCMEDFKIKKSTGHLALREKEEE